MKVRRDIIYHFGGVKACDLASGVVDRVFEYPVG